MKTSITLFLLCFIHTVTVCFGQTKWIAHKSHSGSAHSFYNALISDRADLRSSNFGIVPMEEVKYAVLDTVEIISDTIAIMVTSDFCQNRFTEENNLWEAGRDTIFHHPLFNLNNELKQIKNTLDKRYHFRNPADSVIFIGFNDSKYNDSQRGSQTPDTLTSKSLWKIDSSNGQKNDAGSDSAKKPIKSPVNLHGLFLWLGYLGGLLGLLFFSIQLI